MAAFKLFPQSATSLCRSPSQSPQATAAALSISHPSQKSAKPQYIPLNSTRTSLLTPKQPRIRFSASLTNPTVTLFPSTDPQSLLTGSTRTVTSIATVVFSLSRVFLNSLLSFARGIAILPNTNQLGSLAYSVRPLFFAALKDRPRGYLNTPLTVVAAGLAKWLDIYSGVLMVRVLLSWFPNIPWDRQPLSAIRDLCDPYLNLFRNIIPPIFDTLDVSPLLAFAVLGTLGSILNSSRGMY
ncbi:hypothetical protein K2173_000568 [Erythroxylum novogranatense]|uniref:Uncharacterized protein n=1 Tax=Erythroxylum novogranatense TaxID=1862640 RepID=A0AAV8S7Z8_9ROSI|nr:hypothetical protein K2173_000568 [Erythroxylum novogranatense]